MITRVSLLVAAGLLVASCSSGSEPELTIPEFPSETQSETVPTPDTPVSGQEQGEDAPVSDEQAGQEATETLSEEADSFRPEWEDLSSEELAELGVSRNKDGGYSSETWAANSHQADTAYYAAIDTDVKAREAETDYFKSIDLAGEGPFSSTEVTDATRDGMRFLAWSARWGSQSLKASQSALEGLRNTAGAYATDKVLKKLAAGGEAGRGKDVAEMGSKLVAKYAPAPAGICDGYNPNCTAAPITQASLQSVSVVTTPGGQDGLLLKYDLSYSFYPVKGNEVSAPTMTLSYSAAVTMAPNPDLTSVLEWVVVDIKTSNGGVK